MNVTELLENGPERICKAESALCENRKQLDKAKLRLEAARASALILNQGAKNQKLLEAMVSQDPEVQKAEAAVIDALGDVKLAEINVHLWENAFASARKLASLNMTVNDIATPSSL